MIENDFRNLCFNQIISLELWIDSFFLVENPCNVINWTREVEDITNIYIHVTVKFIIPISSYYGFISASEGDIVWWNLPCILFHLTLIDKITFEVKPFINSFTKIASFSLNWCFQSLAKTIWLLIVINEKELSQT